MKIINVVGARPNFIKITPLIKEISKYKSIKQILLHTGQHYDKNMSKLFFEELKIPKPDINLNVGSGSHAEQTAKIMLSFEKVLLKERPNLVIVVGDVNSTIGCALTAVKLDIKIAHVEAGLRSFDMSMPEEINRVLTDQISDYLFITERSALKNLLMEGINKKKIYFVGNVMIDTLLRHKKKAESSQILKRLNIVKKNYGIITLHRPRNVDNKDVLSNIIKAFEVIQQNIKLVMPLHPRTKKMINKFKLNVKMKNLIMTEPLGYLDFLKLMANSKFVLTDSGGVQEETTVLRIPCITLRPNTERPVTVTEGTNVIVGNNKQKIINESMKVISGKCKKGKIPKYWDGKAAKRIIKVIRKEFKI